MTQSLKRDFDELDASIITPEPSIEAITTPAPSKFKKTKVALLIAYNGENFLGMQINNNGPTIEHELHNAFFKSGGVSAANANVPSKVGFTRAARTDKGVHAAGNVVALNLMLLPDIIKRINDNLPPQIRVFDYVKVTSGFNSKNMCDSRIYEYSLPTYVFDKIDASLYPNSNFAKQNPPSKVRNDKEIAFPITPTLDEMKIKRSFKISDAKLSLIDKILEKYNGTHNFHNFTIGKKFTEPNALRFIKSFAKTSPFIINSTEYISFKIHGQSFMLHQIRKMIGLLILMVRTETDAVLVDELYKNVKVNIPKAPSLGLLLDHPLFSAYNKKWEKQQKPITFDNVKSEVDEFKKEFIYSSQNEVEDCDFVFEKWVRFVDSHWFQFEWYLRDGKIDETLKPANYSVAVDFDNIKDGVQDNVVENDDEGVEGE